MKNPTRKQGHSIDCLQTWGGCFSLCVCLVHGQIIAQTSYFSNPLHCGAFSRVWHLCPLIHRKSRINRAQSEKNTPRTVAGLGIARAVMADIKCWSDWFHDTKHLIASKRRDNQSIKHWSSLRALAELWVKNGHRILA